MPGANDPTQLAVQQHRVGGSPFLHFHLIAASRNSCTLLGNIETTYTQWKGMKWAC